MVTLSFKLLKTQYNFVYHNSRTRLNHQTAHDDNDVMAEAKTTAEVYQMPILYSNIAVFALAIIGNSTSSLSVTCHSSKELIPSHMHTITINRIRSQSPIQRVYTKSGRLSPSI